MEERTKGIFKEIFLFSGSLLLVLWGLNIWVDSRIDLHSELQYRELIHPQVKADCIILGTSKSGESINPKYLLEAGINAYNFSIDSSDPVYFNKWYRELFTRYYPKPRVIIYGVDWVMFENKGRILEHDSQYFPAPYFWKKLFDPKLNKVTLLSNRWALFKYRLFVFKLLTGSFSYSPWRMQDAYKGYVPVEGVGELEKVKVEQIDRINPEYLECFNRLLDLWKSEGIAVIFAQTPDYIPGRESDNLERNMRMLRQIADERGIPYLDYNGGRVSPLNYEKKYFRDWTHLNYQGAEKFSGRFAADLRDLLKRMELL